jgi:methionyl-tRNA formyltransferase
MVDAARTPPLRFAFAADRDIGVWVLDYLLERGDEPVALLVSEPGKASHAEELIARFARPGIPVLRGRGFREPEGLRTLATLNLDLVVGIHFPYLVPADVLGTPRIGVLNLHPAYLPYNRGWHTPSWAILEGTPVGATLHFMDVGIDSGDVIHQKELEISPGDTANSLYARLKRLELDVFREAWPQIAAGTFRRTSQDPHAGTSHRRSDLFHDSVRRIVLEDSVRADDLLRRLRALTTSSVEEAAYFEAGGKRYRVQVHIQEEDGGA